MAIAVTLASCGAGASSNSSKESAKTKSEAKAIEKGTLMVYSFHTNQRCITCKAIEKLTKEVVEEMGNDKIKLEVINISDKWNEALADKYEVTWSSLVLDNGAKANNVTQMAFQYAKNQPDVFKSNLRNQLEKML